VAIPDFQTYRAALEERGFRAVEVRYDERAFGSWHVELEGQPAIRLAWWGKEQWLLAQRRSGDEWVDAWIGRDARDQTPASAITQLERLRGQF
jgi:hypothetical protein